MGHEDSVYLAKLAEQAERYEGIDIILRVLFRENINSSDILYSLYLFEQVNI